MSWFDRLLGESLATLPALVDPGRFCRTGKPGVTFNGHTQLLQGILVSDGSDRCQLDDEVHGFVPPKASLSPKAELFACALESLDANISRGATLTSPLMPAEVINVQSHLLPFEVLLLEVINKGHLHQVSLRPRLDLHYEDEVTDVARAKRMAKGALVHLASHSECWQRQTLSGVIPRKVLARFSEDDYNTYENRVYARLLDGIERHLRRRIATLEQLQGTLSQALEFYGADGLDHRLSNAICELWGKTFSNEEMTSKASQLLDETLRQLASASKAVAGLKQTGLYPLVPRSAQVSGGLHLTNILSHDAHYRHVAVLWEALRKVQGSAGKTPQERHQQNRQLASAYSRYAGLMLRHALEPYLQGKDEAQWAGRTLSLRPSGLEWELSSSIRGADAKVLLTVVPWFSFTDRPGDAHGHPQRVIAWPALDQVSNEAALDAGWIALSPFDLYGVERFGHLVDSILWQPVLQAYGKPITKVPSTVMHGAGEPVSAISLEPGAARMVVREVLPDKRLAQLQQALSAANASPQAEALLLRQLELVALQACPVCEEPVSLVFQQPAGFKANCGRCTIERYLRHQARHWEYEQKLGGEVDFRKVGRRALNIQGARLP
ncbi:hypothetical protein [Pseudomonas sp. GM55]|uniref:hypothetical protein n=1 Tax=Pseudomonas sp. GM55 TaxID=1144333 RepID=UPI00027087D1|nr:hypothetical protein [Pseudomonas sp. GM55]EJM69377.1 hypothetical protein PMI31_04720 [Pseudomonas sp. GM55]